MLYLIGMLGGFGLVTFFLRSLISKFGSGKSNVALKEFLDPMVQSMESGMHKKATEVLGQAQSEIFSRMSGMPNELKKDLEKVVDSGFCSLQGVLKKNIPHLDLDDNNEAVFTITNDSVQPFQLSDAMMKECQRITEGKISDLPKAKAIFKWFEQNITYDHVRASQNGTGYRNARRVFEDKEGICGEMAFLYIVMAWYVGIKSASFISVEIDNTGNKVAHACAAFKHNGKLILVDPAYHKFDIKHEKYEVWDNEKTIAAFKSWN